ncbi:hypothetical protein [Brevundimonas sp.]|uniref:hypothetical protein n=1 Tax=Brevundimonas sp. TaxID=1871086 RepID=UPI0028972145|nr:hypothetical protein [Brevundimonas sp.]
MAPRLKVFEWSDGFHRFTVAASSRPKALAAWGVQQDIFASGLAREVPEAEDAEAARARPGEVIERGLAVDVGEVGPRRERVRARKRPTAAQKRRVEELAGRLQALETSYAESAEGLRQETARLEARAADEKARFEKARTRLIGDLSEAREKL